MYTQAEVEQLMEETRRAERGRIADAMDVASRNMYMTQPRAELRELANQVREGRL